MKIVLIIVGALACLWLLCGLLIASYMYIASIWLGGITLKEFIGVALWGPLGLFR